MSATAMEKMVREEDKRQRFSMFVNALERFVRHNVDIVGMTKDDQEQIAGAEVDIRLLAPQDDSLADMLREHLEAILTLLPEGVTVVDTAILKMMDDAVPLMADGLPTVSGHMSMIAEHYGVDRISRQAFDVRQRRDSPFRKRTDPQ